MWRPRRFTFEADGASLAIEVGRRTDPLATELVRRATSGFAPATRASSATLRIARHERTGARVSSHIRRDQRAEPTAAAIPYGDGITIDVADVLAHVVDEWIDAASLAWGTSGAVRLHAAAFARHGRTTVVAGPSGSGKSTSVLAALTDGAAYLTDERVTLRPGAWPPEVRGLPRALRARDELGHHVPGGDDVFAGTAGADAFRQIVYADAMSPRGGVVTDWSEPTRLVLLTAPPAVPLRRGWVVAQLVEQSMNAILCGVDGLRDIAALVASTEVQVAGPRHLGPVSEPALLAPTGIEPRVEVAAPDGPAAPGVGTVRLGDEALLWVPGTPPRVLHLVDAAAEAWVDLLHGAQPADHRVAPFVVELVAAGALRSSTAPRSS